MFGNSSQYVINMVTAHTRQTAKAYICSIQFHNQNAQQEPI